MDELKLILDASREKEERNQKFMAAIQGIDIGDNEKQDAQEAVDRIKRKIAAEQAGKTGFEYDMDELGFDVEKD